MKENSPQKGAWVILIIAVFLILFGGIKAADSVITFAKTQQIEIVNNLLEGFMADSSHNIKPQKIRDITIKYVSAFVKALAEFEFVPRGDFGVLVEVLSAVPDETQVLGFSYNRRNLTIHTVQDNTDVILQMSKKLEETNKFEKVVTSYFLKNNNLLYFAEITLIANYNIIT